MSPVEANYRLRDFEEIKTKATGDISELNRRLLRISRDLLRHGKRRAAVRTPPGRIVISLFRKAVNTFEAIEIVKRKGLIEEAWILLRVLLEAHVNLLYFLRHDPKEMTYRYLDAGLLDKLKHLREVSFYEGTPQARFFDRADWEKKEREIKQRYSEAAFIALRKHGFSGLLFEQRAKVVGLQEMYQYCYRIASRSVHMFDPAETAVFAVAFGNKASRRYELLRARREQLDANQHALLGRLAYLMSEFCRAHRTLELVLIAAGYDKFLDKTRSRVRLSPKVDRKEGEWWLWPF